VYVKIIASQTLTCYNLDIHDPIAIIFGRNVTKKVRNQMMLFPTSPVLQHYLAKDETQKTVHWCFVHATQFNCCSALDFLSPVPCPPSKKSPKLNALITIFRESYSSVRMNRESKRLKKSSSDWLNSGNALIQRVKNAIFVFFVLSGSAEAQGIWGAIVKRRLIAYFIGNISDKNIKIRSRVSKL